MTLQSAHQRRARHPSRLAGLLAAGIAALLLLAAPGLPAQDTPPAKSPGGSQSPMPPAAVQSPANQAQDQPALPVLKPKEKETAAAPPEEFIPIPLLNIEDLKRMIQIAQDSGLSEEHINQITIEDVTGRKVQAREYLRQYERWRKAQRTAQQAKDTKVYLTPQDVLRDLNANQSKEVDRLRDELLLVD